MEQFQELDRVFDNHFGEAPTLPDDQQLDSLNSPEPDEVNVDIDDLTRHFCEPIPSVDTANDLHEYNATDETLLSCDEICRSECACLKNCLSQFTSEEIQQNVFLLRELEKTERDMLLMGILKQIGINKKSTVGERKRVRYRYAYQFKNQQICRHAFQVIYDIKECTLDNLQKHLQQHGTTPRVHGNTGKRPHNAFTFNEIRNSIQFVVNFAEQYGLPQPAASRGQDNAPPIFLACSETKQGIHAKYQSSCEEQGEKSLGLSTFKDVWQQCIPHIKISNPRQDVCHTCELMRKRIQDAVGDAQKLKTTAEFQEHLMKAQIEKEAYQRCVRRSTEELTDANKDARPAPPMSTPYTQVHYTFDFSQQMQIPHHARQMGPIYFVVPRKIQLFGVRLDGIPHQYNYMIDEAQTIGVNGSKIHGPDAVISMLDHAFESYGFGETDCVVHADNCSGQNKNRYLIAYFAWRVIVGKHRQITYMMQVPGHARCLVDSNFAHIKRKYKRSDVESLLQLRQIVDSSCYSNSAVMYAEETSWQWRDWKGYLGDTFQPLKGIRSCQVFRFSADHPGTVFTRSSANSEERAVKLLRTDTVALLDATTLPDVIPAAGIDEYRRKYLFTHVRKFVRDPWKNITCPAPNAEE